MIFLFQRKDRKPSRHQFMAELFLSYLVDNPNEKDKKANEMFKNLSQTLKSTTLKRVVDSRSF